MIYSKSIHLNSRDEKLNKIYLEFRQYAKDSNKRLICEYGYIIRLILQSMDITLADINWAKIIEMISVKLPAHYINAPAVIMFLYFLIENGYYEGDYEEDIVYNKDNIVKYSFGIFNNKDKTFLEDGIVPLSFIVYLYRRGKDAYCQKHLIIPYNKRGLLDLIMQYVQFDKSICNERSKREKDVSLFRCFYKSLENKYEINYITDFNDATFEQQAKFFISHPEYGINDVSGCSILCALMSLYIYVERILMPEQLKKQFKVYDITTLKYNKIEDRLKNGYQILNYNIYDEPPFILKMLLKENNMDRNSTLAKDMLTTLELDFINNKVLQLWYLRFFWKNTSITFLYRKKALSLLRMFLIRIDKKYQANDKIIEIKADDVIAFKRDLLTKYNRDSTVARGLSHVKQFLYFLGRENYLEIDAIVYRILVHKDSNSEAYKDAYTKHEVHELLNSFRNYSEKEDDYYSKCCNQLYHLYYCALAMMTISEMRISFIFALTTNSLQTTLTKAGGNEYKLVVRSKSVNDECDEYNITKFIKELFDEVLEVTKETREYASNAEKNMLFIYKRRNQDTIAQCRTYGFERHMKKICKLYGIRWLRPAGIRNYYQQSISDYISDNGYDPMLIEKLGKHTLSTHIKNYDQIDIREFCQRYYQVEIGTIYLKGTVTEQNLLPETQTVANGCGHCSLEKCGLMGKLDCFVCEHFVATLDCIPSFEKTIENINTAMVKQCIPHEKEFLFTKKRLLVAYLTKLMELDSKVNGDANNYSSIQ